jgi:iron complex transport system substrate-binding protein
MKKYIYLIAHSICLLFLVSCTGSGNGSRDVQSCVSTIAGSDSLFYAQGFSIETHEEYTLLKIRNPWDTNKWLQTYVLVPQSKNVPDNLPEGLLLRTPLQKTVCFSSVICGFFEELAVLNTLTGVAEPQYIDIPFVKEGISGGKIQDIGQASNPTIEKLMLIEPEAIFFNPINDPNTGAFGKLNIPIIYCVEYLENHPLGQTEWIRFFGRLFDQKELADSLFFATVRSYNELKELTASVAHPPTVFTELKYGDFWYMPGGKSYLAHILEDANTDYILKDDLSTGSLPLSFETVLDKADKADYWLFKYYSPQEMTYKQLAADFTNYTLFDAYKNRNIYVCNTSKVPYYQELPLHPDWVLKDMIKVFHPEVLPEYQSRYYTKMKE